MEAPGSDQDPTSQQAILGALAEERSRLRAVLDSIPDLIWLKDPEGRFLACNPAFERLLGAPEAKLVGKTDYDFVDSELADFFRDRDRRAVEAGRPLLNEEWVTFASDGHRALLETVKTAMRDPQGRLLGVVGVGRDVTESRRIAAALRQSEERLRLFIEHAPAALAMFDREMRYLSVSQRWRTDFGLADAELLGRCHYEVLPEISDEWKGIHQRALAGEIVRASEDRFERVDGSVQWVRWEVRPWRDAAGRIGGILVFTEEITERKLAVEALRESEAHFRALAETSFECSWDVDLEGRYRSVSPRIIELLGYTPAELEGRSRFDLMPQQERERVRELFGQHAARREPFASLENLNLHRDGRVVIFESSGVPYFGRDGDLLGYRGVDRDVTARRQAQRRSATQAAVSRVLAQSRSLEEAAPQVLAEIAASEGWELGTLWTVDPALDALRCAELWRAPGLDADRLEAVTRELRIGPGEALAGEVWLARQPFLVPDITGDVGLHRNAAARELGLRSEIAFPLMVGGEVIGVIDFLGRSVLGPEPGLLETFETIGRQIGQFVERRRAEQAIRRFVSGSPAVIYALTVEPNGLHYAWHGGRLEELSGWSDEDARQAAWWTDNLHPDDRAQVLGASRAPYETDQQNLEFRFRRKDGSYFWVRDQKRLLRDESGRPTEVVGSWTDVTERVELEQKLRISQKLEALGRLAGGVAHDFNNLLTVISGNGELLANALARDSPNQLLLNEIRDAGERAAALIHQLLAFSRSQTLSPRVLALGDVVRRVEGMLRRLIGADVELVCEIDSSAGRVCVDPNQIEQVLLNLAVNARDAMPRGGTLTLACRAVEVDEEGRPDPEIEPGRYLELSVVDDGVGMGAEVRERIFEPFFTTKEQGKGTGLGLATVFGIVTQSGGHIEVESEPGRGTRFRILFPRVDEQAPLVATASTPEPAPRGRRETILLAEDEEGVRKLARIALERQGYRVLVAENGRAAATLIDAEEGGIDLLLTDLVMPEMGGRELASLVRSRWPAVPILLMSGYAEASPSEELELETIHKPFSLEGLARAVRATLDRQSLG